MSSRSRSRDNRSRERSRYEIYIGNYPVYFEERDLRDLFEEHNIEVRTVRLKKDGHKV